jgi:hypothetical protein
VTYILTSNNCSELLSCKDVQGSLSANFSRVTGKCVDDICGRKNCLSKLQKCDSFCIFRSVDCSGQASSLERTKNIYEYRKIVKFAFFVATLTFVSCCLFTCLSRMLLKKLCNRCMDFKEQENIAMDNEIKPLGG